MDLFLCLWPWCVLTDPHAGVLQSPVCVAGYPVGGDSLSITKGIVSRVTMVRYSQGGRLLGIQIDAAINPGDGAQAAAPLCPDAQQASRGLQA